MERSNLEKRNGIVRKALDEMRARMTRQSTEVQKAATTKAFDLKAFLAPKQRKRTSRDKIRENRDIRAKIARASKQQNRVA